LDLKLSKVAVLRLIVFANNATDLAVLIGNPSQTKMGI